MARIPDVVPLVIAAAKSRLGPAYVSACLWGSHARGDPIETSDIDVGIFARAGTPRAECDQLEQEIDRAFADAPLDFAVMTLDELDGRDAVSFRYGAVHLDGENLSSAVPLPSRDEWIDLCESSALWFVTRRRSRPVVVPLPPIRADDEFLGYVCRTIRLGDRELPATKEPLTIAGRIASADVARASGAFVCDRTHAIRAYAESPGGAAAAFLAELEQHLRARWRYLVPEAAAERNVLRGLLERTLEFERAWFAQLAARTRGPRTEKLWRRVTSATPGDAPSSPPAS